MADVMSVFDDLDAYGEDLDLAPDGFDVSWVESSLPSDLERIPAGLFLEVALHGVDRARLSAADTVRLVKARDRQISHLQAEKARDIAQCVTRCGDPSDEVAVSEVGAALVLTDTAARGELELADHLVNRLPQVGDMLRRGVIDMRRARVLCDTTAQLTQDEARQVVADVADRVPELTTDQIRALVRRRTIAVNPEQARERLEKGMAERRVWVGESWFSTGTAEVLISGVDPAKAVAAQEHINALARMLPTNDGRTMDQRRADVALDLLCGYGPDASRGTVDITVDLVTLMGLADQPAELGGWGPVIADIARQVVDAQRDCRWQATVIDDNGDPYAVAVRRRPTASQARQVRARHPRCVFPGCRRPARKTDLDHINPHARGGPTLEHNLAPLCERHHTYKTNGLWNYRRLPNGNHQWTSPLGHTYTTRSRDP